MSSYAAVEDLTAGWAGWYKLSEAEQNTAPTILERASAYLDMLFEKHGVTVDPADLTQATNLTNVVCNMARRAMSPGYDGVKSFAQAIGSTNVSVNYRNNDGGFFLTKAEKELLGISGRGKAFMLRPAIHNPDGSLAEGW